MCVTAPWWQEMRLVLENMHVDDFMHWDLWLKKRKRDGLAPDLRLCQPLAGYGYRQSDTQRKGPCFGGAWLPQGVQGAPTAGEDLALVASPPAVKDWYCIVESFSRI